MSALMEVGLMREDVLLVDGKDISVGIVHGGYGWPRR